MTEIERIAAERYMIDGRSVARQIIRNVISQSLCIDCAAQHTSDYHVKHIEHAQSLKKMLESHNFFQANHKGGAQYGIGKATADGRQIEL